MFEHFYHIYHLDNTTSNGEFINKETENLILRDRISCQYNTKLQTKLKVWTHFPNLK